MKSMLNQKPLFNPLKDNVIIHSFRDDNTEEIFSLPSQEISWIEEPRYELIKKHLANAVFNAEGNAKFDHELEMTKIYDRIEVKLDG